MSGDGYRPSNTHFIDTLREVLGLCKLYGQNKKTNYFQHYEIGLEFGHSFWDEEEGSISTAAMVQGHGVPTDAMRNIQHASVVLHEKRKAAA